MKKIVFFYLLSFFTNNLYIVYYKHFIKQHILIRPFICENSHSSHQKNAGSGAEKYKIPELNGADFSGIHLASCRSRSGKNG